MNKIIHHLIYLIILIKDILLSTFYLALELIKSIFLKYPIQSRLIELSRSDLTDYQSIIISIYITLTPGTYTVDLNEKIISIHALKYIHEDSLEELKRQTQKYIF